MIRLVDAFQQTPVEMLDAPGGFAWWYVDIVDSEGNGAVLIWSWGLPFLPGYTDAARRGAAPPARERPSLNLAIYRAGRPAYYLLQTYPTDEAAWEGDEWRFGATRIVRRRSEATTEVTAELDVHDPTTGGRLRGRVEVAGPTCRFCSEARNDVHAWGPITVGGRASLRAELGTHRWDVEGHGYHDRNWSPTHLDSLGIRRWTWFRATGSGGTRIVYHLEGDGGVEPRLLHCRVAPDGAARVLSEAARIEHTERDRFGLSYPRVLKVGDGEIRMTRTVDRGPFYLRALATWSGPDGTESGIAEVVAPPRIDRAGMRPLIRMAVDDASRRRSIWLPLFSGPSEGRVKRLLLGGELR